MATSRDLPATSSKPKTVADLNRISPDVKWCEAVRQIDDPLLLLELLSSCPEYMTDSYYRELGNAMQDAVTEVLKAAGR